MITHDDLAWLSDWAAIHRFDARLGEVAATVADACAELKQLRAALLEACDLLQDIHSRILAAHGPALAETSRAERHRIAQLRDLATERT